MKPVERTSLSGDTMTTPNRASRFVRFLRDDLGETAVWAMEQIKRALDPEGLLNPGKVFPQRGGEDHSGFLTALPSLEGLTPG